MRNFLPLFKCMSIARMSHIALASLLFIACALRSKVRPWISSSTSKLVLPVLGATSTSNALASLHFSLSVPAPLLQLSHRRMGRRGCYRSMQTRQSSSNRTRTEGCGGRKWTSCMMNAVCFLGSVVILKLHRSLFFHLFSLQIVWEVMELQAISRNQWAGEVPGSTFPPNPVSFLRLDSPSKRNLFTAPR